MPCWPWPKRAEGNGGMIMGTLFDDVSRIIASPVSRRKALKMVSGAFGGAILTSLGLGRPSWAQTSASSAACKPACASGQTCCNGKCCGSGQKCCNGVCCSPGSTCCNGKCCSGPCCEDKCCAANQMCCEDKCVTKTVSNKGKCRDD